MPRGFLFLRISALITGLSLRAIAADVPPVVPVVQLTAQAGRFSGHDNCLGGLLFRELQRQAVLIAAREELGIGTRDMVLREPFVAHGTNDATTVLFESRIWKNGQSQICLARFDGTQPTDPYALADLQVDRGENTDVQWANFKTPKGPNPDYAEFAVRCEDASRTSYLKALLAENVLNGTTANPVPWVSPNATAPADPAALQRLQHFDVFSQYLAARLIHQQMRTDGASPARMTALVQAYANLGLLTHDQWSRANKVFLARALLYAQRLVVHENSSSMSLYARAYARCMTGLHAAALVDLDLADRKGETPPAWAPLVRSMCRYDPYPIEESIVGGPWVDRQLSTFLAERVAIDKFPQDQFQDALDRALNTYPGMFVLASDSPAVGDANNPRPADQVINQIPVVLVDSLKTAAFPSSVLYAIRHVAPGDDSYKEIAAVRDRLNTIATKTPLETTEPSLGVLADLIEQQEFLAVIHRAMGIKATSAGTTDLQKLIGDAMPILHGHPWGPFADALNQGPNADDQKLAKYLGKITDRDAGPWVEDTFNHLDSVPGASVKNLRDSARYTADALVTDFTPNGDEPYLSRLCKTSPHSGTLLEAWLRAVPMDRVVKNTSLYNSTIKRVEDEFCNRPAVVLAACDWCNARGEFNRSLNMLGQIDTIEPSVDTCLLLSRLHRKLGNRDQALSDLMRAVKMGDPSEIGNAYQQAAVDLMEDHRYDEALSCIQMSSEAPNPRIWQLMARCYEAMGQFDNADECLQQQTVSDPTSIAQQYMWARRLDRKNVKDIRRKAQLAFAQPSEFMPEFFFCMTEDQEHKARDVLKRYRGSMDDALELAQLVILSRKQNDTQDLKDALAGLPGVSLNQSFGSAFASLVQSKDLSQGITAFNQWIDRQLYDENAVDWYSLAGRYLIAAGHTTEGRSYLIQAIRQSAHEHENYYLAWRELQKMGDNPQQLTKSPTTQQ